MAEPTTTIVALQGLVTKLVESIKDRKAAADAKEFLKLMNALQTEHFELQKSILKLQTENAKLRQQAIQPDEITTEVKIDELAIRMLRFLSQNGHALQTPHELSHHLGITVTRARHCADILVRGGYICDHQTGNGAIEYELDDKGREFLVAHNLDV
jgi:hypothetical protein